MIRGMWSSATGMGAQQLRLDIISNNLANVNTTGFKKSRADFEDLIYQTDRQAGGELPGGGQVPTSLQVGLGVRPVAISKIFSQGDYVHTENELDIAIEGKGFFKILSNGIEYYTRAGSFRWIRMVLSPLPTATGCSPSSPCPPIRFTLPWTPAAKSPVTAPTINRWPPGKSNFTPSPTRRA